MSKRKATEFQAFTRAHQKQQVQIVVAGKVTETTILYEIIGPMVQVQISSSNEARAFADSVTKK
jgi:hypothetical protein